MKIAITGTRGTLGRALVRRAEASGHQLLHLNRPEYDITDPRATLDAIDEFNPGLVIHPAAYTNVDEAESQPVLAFAVNGLGTRNVALACEAVGVPLIYISTNMVFDGTASSPYTELESRNPKGAYACSKYAGERYVEGLMTRFYIARVSWLYGREGDSFIHKIVRAADARGSLGVVADEVATPTYAEDLADALLQLAGTGLYGWYHLINEGECSRYDYAREILRLTGRDHISVEPTALADYARPAPTPPYSPLANVVGAHAGVTLRPWKDALASYLAGVETPGVPG